jgi:hypothetical protein
MKNLNESGTMVDFVAYKQISSMVVSRFDDFSMRFPSYRQNLSDIQGFTYHLGSSACKQFWFYLLTIDKK